MKSAQVVDRPAEAQSDDIYEFGDFALDRSQRLLTRAGEPVAITAKAFDALHYLAARPGQLVSRAELAAALWPKTVVEDNNLSQTIKALRRALGDSESGQRFIVTVPRQGYQFVAGVTRRPRKDSASVPSTPIPTLEAQVPGAASGQRRFVVPLAALGLAVALAVAGLGTYVGTRDQQTASGRSAGAPPIEAAAPQRIAILPFKNLSADPANAFFAEGMHEQVVVALASHAPDLEVISRATMLTYQSKPIATVAKELGAQHVIEGSINREGDDMRLTLQLIDARRDRTAWSHVYDRKLTNAMALQAEVARDVATQLSTRLAGNVSDAAFVTQDPIAHDLYLKARLAAHLLNPGSTTEELREPLRLLDAAIARDERFVAALLERSVQLRTTRLNRTVLEPSAELLRRAREDLERARGIVGEDPRVLAGEAGLTLAEDAGNAQRAEQIMRRVDGAGLATPEWLRIKINILVQSDRIEEALATYQRLLAVDRANANTLGGYMNVLRDVRRPREVLRILDIPIANVPVRAMTRGKVVFDYSGRTDELRAALDRNGHLISPEARVAREFDARRFERRFADLNVLLAETKVSEFHDGRTGDGGRWPIAILQGRAALLNKDADAARRAGRALAQYVRTTAPTEWRAGNLRALGAESELLLGRDEEAIAATHEALALRKPGVLRMLLRDIEIRSAVVFAWAGAKDESIALLEDLSTSIGGLAPAEITREPLYTIPLASEPRFIELSARLEQQMKEIALE